jgi:cytochrome P450
VRLPTALRRLPRHRERTLATNARDAPLLVLGLTRQPPYPHAACSDKTRLFAPKFGASPLFEQHTTSLVFSDPPCRTRVRATLTEALKRRAIQATVVVLERVIARLLDELARDEAFDLIERFASRPPVEIVSSLLTVSERDRTRPRNWSLAILGVLEPTLSDPELALGNGAVMEFLDYLRGLVALRRREPSVADNDVLASLVAQHDRGEIDERELLHSGMASVPFVSTLYETYQLRQNSLFAHRPQGTNIGTTQES